MTLAMVCLTIVAVAALVLCGFAIWLSYKDDNGKDNSVKDAVSGFGFQPNGYEYEDED